MKFIWAIALAAALLSSASLAQSVGPVLEEFGLLDGRWAADCSKDPSPSNWYGRYRVLPSSEARLTFSAQPGDGGNDDLVYVILQARRVADHEILIGVEVVREKRQLEVVLHVEGDRYHTISVQRPDGGYQIKDGKYTDDGTDSPWFNRCR
jgi:opacity protein-like surface antigen